MQREMAEEADVAALAELQELGMQYDELPPEEIAKIREATAGVVDTIKERAGEDLVDAVLAAVAAAES
jgi:TRAP-type C4-dicarboxylate transport system substrate-binding protein